MNRLLKNLARGALALAIICLILCPFLLTTCAQAAPFRASATVNAGSGTYVITNVYNSVSTGVRLTHVLFTSAASSTSTASFIVGTLTNSIGSKVITATDRLLVATNAPPLLVGDTLRFTASDTNSQTVYIIGDEY
jgi:hypothetical protein